jgi:hypothetical protein
MSSLNRDQQLGLFTKFLTLMQELCWGPADLAAKNYVPMSKETQEAKQKESQYGKTRKKANLAMTYLSMLEAHNIGGDPKKIEQAYHDIKNYKHYFIEFMQSKENTQLKQECNDNIKLGIKLNKPYKCNHKNHLLGREGASKLADSIIKAYYDTELRAFQEPSQNWAFTREPGNVEFGILNHAPELMTRQVVELPQGEFFDPHEDETVSGFSLADQMNWNKYSDDEDLSDVDSQDFKSNIVDFSARNETYLDCRRSIMRASNSDNRERLVRRAENMAKLGEISDWQARACRYFAWQCNTYYNNQRKKQIELERANNSQDSNQEEWISL